MEHKLIQLPYNHEAITNTVR